MGSPMSKTISFKVPDHVYHELKKQDSNFRELFEPVAWRMANICQDESKYTIGIPQQNYVQRQTIADIDQRVDRLLLTKYKRNSKPLK